MCDLASHYARWAANLFHQVLFLRLCCWLLRGLLLTSSWGQTVGKMHANWCFAAARVDVSPCPARVVCLRSCSRAAAPRPQTDRDTVAQAVLAPVVLRARGPLAPLTSWMDASTGLAGFLPVVKKCTFYVANYTNQGALNRPNAKRIGREFRIAATASTWRPWVFIWPYWLPGARV